MSCSVISQITQRFYRGDGRELKQDYDRCEIPEVFPPDEPDENCTWTEDASDATYSIRSTVFGGEVIVETNSYGYKSKRMVLVGGEVIAYLTYRPGAVDAVHFRQTDALGISERITRAYPEDLFGVVEEGYIDPRHTESDPMGNNMGIFDPYFEPVQPPDPTPIYPYFQDLGDSPTYVNGQLVTCTLDGMSIGCATAQSMLGNSAIPAELAQYQHRPGFRFEDRGLGLFSASWNVYTPGRWTNTSVSIGGQTSSGDPEWQAGSWSTGTSSFSLKPAADLASWYKRITAANDAKRVLRNDKKCARFFGLLDRNGSVSKPRIEALFETVRIKQDTKSYANIAHTRENEITLEALFFIDGVFVISEQPYSIRNPRKGRAQTILHEIGHALKLLISPDNTSHFPKDPTSPANRNERTIRDNCSKGLSKVPDSYPTGGRSR